MNEDRTDEQKRLLAIYAATSLPTPKVHESAYATAKELIRRREEEGASDGFVGVLYTDNPLEVDVLPAGAVYERQEVCVLIETADCIHEARRTDRPVEECLAEHIIDQAKETVERLAHQEFTHIKDHGTGNN